tara:strand:- start:2006 stop:2887 length:882 start_codon:yes stop_codon:yes gene_type:complete
LRRSQFGANNFGGDAFGGAGGASQGGGFEVNNSGPDAKKQSLNKQSLMPCTIKQLKTAPAGTGADNAFVIDGQDLHQVTIVGLITHADEQNTNLQFTIDDGTGSIVAKMWIDAAQDEATMEKRSMWKEGVIVRVVGQMRAFNQVRSVVAFHIQPLTDMNEYTFHFVEVVHTHLRNTKGKPGDQAAPPVGGGMGGMGGGAFATGMAGGVAPPSMAAAAAAQQNAQGLNNFQDTVFKFFQSYGESQETGATVEECTNAMMAQGGTAEQVRKAVDDLVNEGHLYSTIDDDHFKATS